MKDYHQDPMILSYPPGHRWTTSSGWDLRHAQHHRANNAGFLAHRDFVPNPEAIALIGDSLVEASSLDREDRPDIQLERALGGRPVYGLSGPGSALLDYAERMRFAHERYGIRQFVLLLEGGDVKQSLCGSGNVHGPCLDPQSLQPRVETLPPPGSVKRVLRHLALPNYLLGQLKISGPQLWQQALRQARPEAPRAASAHPMPSTDETPADRAVAEAFLQRTQALRQDSRVLLLLDSAREHLYAGHPERAPLLQRFAQRMQAAGVEVLDLTPAFAATYAQQGLRLEVGPDDSHYNALGVRSLTQAAAARWATAPDLPSHKLGQ